MNGTSPVLSRRTLLKAGLLTVPVLAGGRLLSACLSSPADASAMAAEPLPEPLAYDPSAHAWVFVCDATKCIGCGFCVEACKAENDVPIEPECNRTWVERHTIAEDGSVVVESPHGGIDGFPPASPREDGVGARAGEAYFVPRLCMQCDAPPCVSVCPVSATYKTEDGVVLVDASKCIGCGYCIVACPYGARYIVPAGEDLPGGYPGVADKCTFCYHRTTNGLGPACAQVCPVGARTFGDLNDPSSPVVELLQDPRIRIMKPEQGTEPRVYYLGLESVVS
jgi:Fe-S-cluster-containing dehydrogenase component